MTVLHGARYVFLILLLLFAVAVAYLARENRPE
jgi:hypothetical protein